MHNWPKPLKFKSEAITHQLLGTFLCHRVPALLAHVFLDAVKPPGTHKTVLFLGSLVTTITYTFTITYLLIPWIRVLLEKLTSSQLVKKFPAFYGIRRFVTAFKSACHLSLSSASSIKSMPAHPTSWWSILILSSHLCLGLLSGLFPSDFPTKTLDMLNQVLGKYKSVNMRYQACSTMYPSLCSDGCYSAYVGSCVQMFWNSQLVLTHKFLEECKPQLTACQNTD